MLHVGGKNAKKKSSSTTKRDMTIVIGNKEHELYVSSSPSSAARKAVSKLCATDKKMKVQFSIREITHGSKKKTYWPYVGKMKKLDKPIELKECVIKYTPDVYLDKKVRNKMRGGENNTNFFYCFYDREIIKKIINYQYKRQIFNEFKIEFFDNVEYVSWGHVLITNRSIGYYLRKNNKPEQITVYACYNNKILYCFAILRCDDYIIYNNNRNYKYKKLYQNKILFLIPSISDIKNIDVKSRMNNGTEIQPTNVSGYEFRSFISSNGDLYRIIFKNYVSKFHNLYNFFNILITELEYDIKTEGPPLVYKPPNRNTSVFSEN